MTDIGTPHEEITIGLSNYPIENNALSMLLCKFLHSLYAKLYLWRKLPNYHGG